MRLRLTRASRLALALEAVRACGRGTVVEIYAAAKSQGFSGAETRGVGGLVDDLRSLERSGYARSFPDGTWEAA